MTDFRYRCTGRVKTEGFSIFLEENLRNPRHNIGIFAEELCERFSVPQMTLVNSGSSANLVAALVLAEKIQEEGKPLEAIASVFTFPTTLSSLKMAGFRIRLIDTETGGFNLCPNALNKALLEIPAALVCVTHFLGFAAAMEKIIPLARKHGAYVMQDACESMELKTPDGHPLHTLGDITTWSFYHPHHLSSYGGGAVLPNTPELYRITDSVAHWGRACTCHIDKNSCLVPAGPGHNFTYLRTGLNVEMSELNACFGRFQLQNWEKMEFERKKRYNLLYQTLKDLSTVKVYNADKHQGSPFVFPVTCKTITAEKVIAMLNEKGIECRTLMGGAMIEQPAFRNLGCDAVPNAEYMSHHSFFVGIHQTLPLDDVAQTADILADCLTAV